MNINKTYSIREKDIRPWGSWEVLEVGDNYIVKKIIVTPNQILSLQSHQHRSEHWIIVEGTAEVTYGEKLDNLLKTTLKSNESIFLKQGIIHRIQNIGQENMIFIEVQYGSILSEDDIKRYEDKYGRVGKIDR